METDARRASRAGRAAGSPEERGVQRRREDGPTIPGRAEELVMSRMAGLDRRIVRLAGLALLALALVALVLVRQGWRSGHAQPVAPASDPAVPGAAAQEAGSGPGGAVQETRPAAAESEADCAPAQQRSAPLGFWKRANASSA